MNKDILSIRILFCSLFLHLIYGQVQINLHLTEWISHHTEKTNVLQHDCIRIVAFMKTISPHGQTISFCMSEWPSKWNIKENNVDPKFTFAQLSKQNITSQQLYRWSAPMDIIEKYQVYLNQLPNSENTSIAADLFYNCTLPSFGPKCEYMLKDYKPYHLSLNDLVRDFYCSNGYEPTTLTCCTHLQCDRGPSPSCLDWTEICDGKIDCLDGGYDEEECWQLELHECNENEYRCFNGQCIPEIFYREGYYIFDCLDRSDEPYLLDLHQDPTADGCIVRQPTFLYEDSACTRLYGGYSTPITSSCVPQRRNLLLQAMFSTKPEFISDECWTAFKCIIQMPVPVDPLCQELCIDGTCDEIINQTCSDIIYAPASPILLGHVFLAYEKNNLKYGFYQGTQSIYVCYNNHFHYLPDDNVNNDTCRLYNNLVSHPHISQPEWLNEYIFILNNHLQMWTSWIYNDSTMCNKSTMYQCINSYKCISKSRLFNNAQDCFHNDDEDISRWDKNCSIKRDSGYFKCQTTDECIPILYYSNMKCDCTLYDGINCNDETYAIVQDKTKIIFQGICDNVTYLRPIMIDGQNHTDETECDQWPCNNIYTRCDNFWNCLNGIDELNCDPLPLLNCSLNHHICVSIETKQPMCLPIERANDGYIDCIGAADEPTLCRADKDGYPYQSFYCKSHDSVSCLNVNQLCDRQSDCINNEDEQSCTFDDFYKHDMLNNICTKDYFIPSPHTEKTLCQVFSPSEERLTLKHFKLGKIVGPYKPDRSQVIARQLPIQRVQYYQQRCHRGLDVQVWLNKEKNLTTSTCLCPPSYYGDVCQFQNQRVSITIGFRPTADSIVSTFSITLSLIDNSEERTIHSYEQFTYIPKYQCGKKFHAYLLYSTRPKNQTKDYSVHIDIYEIIENISFSYRTSVIKPLLFPFLPVYRLSFLLHIPGSNDNSDSCLDRQCINGKCRRYSNDPSNTTFCQCYPGWSGQHCNIQYNCTCSSDSLCIGIAANNRSICICPSNKIGDRCLFNNTVCLPEQNICLNGGQCITVDQYEDFDGQYVCICQKGFIWEKCALNEIKMIVSFDKDIVLPNSIGIHFIQAFESYPHRRTTTFKTIPFGQNSTTVYWSLNFNIIFIELTTKNYYLTLLVNNEQEIWSFETTIYPSNHCLHINELFNETIIKYDLIRRIKYYHLPCQRSTSSHLSCFYDEVHLCLCQDHGNQRVANCFEFNHTMQTNCIDNNGCENGGQCFQDDDLCPQRTFCLCSDCYYGTRCQLNTIGFSLSLDAILGYHIRPNINISGQPTAILVSLILSTIIVFTGMINGILTLITFKEKKLRDVGCGWYLLCSSINILLTMITIAFKVWILVLSHTGSIKNRSFLSVQCYSIDFLLRFCLIMDQWLTTCVTVERAYITVKGAAFNKTRVRYIAKFVIIGLILIVIATNIHDPINRRLFNEKNDEETRIWCIVSYSSTVHIINLVFTLFHVIVPFIINLISAFIIIIMNARRRVIIQKQQSFKTNLRKQFQQHKNLLIGPSVLIILAIPRLIIAFASGCMKSASNAWLFLLGYFISLIPPLLTFILFVLPSSVYLQVFRQAMSRYRNFNRASA